MVDYKEVVSRIKKYSIERNLNYYELLQIYMFERILERISVSKYSNNFILKGGLLLSAMFGIDNRSTKDMDATIKGIDVSKNEMLIILNEILNINLNDGVKFDVIDITDIREDDEYGGNKYHIVARLQNLKVNLEIDISTGDKVTPKELKYYFPLIFSEKKLLINAYNYETILSEKIETVLRRGEYNSRMKDFYDIYIFITKLKEEINFNILNDAMKNTIKKRDSFNYLEDYENILNNMLNNNRLEKLWINFQKKRNYVKDIDINQIILLLIEFIKSNIIIIEESLKV